MNKYFPIFLMLSNLILFSCATIDPTLALEKYLASIKYRLSTVNVEDGISIDEAKIISDNYFSRFKKISGGWSPPFDNGNTWEIKQLGCISGSILEDVPSLFIDKITGKTTWAKGPSIDDPLKIWVSEN